MQGALAQGPPRLAPGLKESSGISKRLVELGNPLKPSFSINTLASPCLIEEGETVRPHSAGLLLSCRERQGGGLKGGHHWFFLSPRYRRKWAPTARNTAAK